MTCSSPKCGKPAIYRSHTVDLIAFFCARCVAIALEAGIDAEYFVALDAVGAPA